MNGHSRNLKCLCVYMYVCNLCIVCSNTLKVGSYSWIIADHQTVQDVRGGVSWNLGQIFWG